MNIIANIKRRLHFNKIKNQIPTRPAQDRHDFQSAKSVAIVADVTLKEAENQLEKYVKNIQALGKKVTVLTISTSKEKDRTYKFDCITKKEITFVGIPVSDKVSAFLNQRFDLLVGLFLPNSLPLEHLSLLSKATFKVGPKTKWISCFDMMVETQNLSLEGLAKNLDRYGSSIQNKVKLQAVA